MVRAGRKAWGMGLLALGCGWGVVNAPAYDLITDESGIYLVTWERGAVPMVVNLADTPALSDGSTAATTVETALATWNTLLGNVQFTWTRGPVGTYALDNGLNEIARDAAYGGYSFGTSTLAITVSFRDDNYRVESDVVFNSAYSWDSYRGNKTGAAYDFRRVALHELGHVLGLSHPDQATPPQTVTALMNSVVSNTDALQPDDIAGARLLYGAVDDPPPNDAFAAATALTLTDTGTVEATGTTVQATAEAGEPELDAKDPGHRTVWWQWQAPVDGEVVVTTLGSQFDTLLGVFVGSAVDQLTVVGINDDVDPGVVRTSRVAFTATAGTTYRIAVDGWSGYEGPVQVNLAFSRTVAPLTVAVVTGTVVEVDLGGTVTLRVSATGTDLRYQWYHGDSGDETQPLAGATAAALTLTPTESGHYWAKVSSATATGDSPTVAVTVRILAPSLTTGLVGATVTAGTPHTLTVQAAGSPPLAYQWYHAGVALTGETEPQLALGATGPADEGDYQVRVSNAAGSVASATVRLAVLPVGVTVRARQATTVVTFARGDAVAVTGRVDFLGAPVEVVWQGLWPADWMLRATGATTPAADTLPPDGANDESEWRWANPSAGSVALACTLAAPDAPGNVELVALVAVTTADGSVSVLAEPDPLVLQDTQHSADTDGDRRVSLAELLRVIELYNTRFGTARTGRYALSAASFDHFAPDARDPAAIAARPGRFHSADMNRDGALSLAELLRVIELYNVRDGTERTGAYHLDPAGVDGFGGGPAGP